MIKNMNRMRFPLLSSALVVAAVLMSGCGGVDDTNTVVSSQSALSANVTIYRLYQPITVEHFYTNSLAEADSAVANLGFQREDFGNFSLYAGPDHENTVAFYRCFVYGYEGAPDTWMKHFYTTDANCEANGLRAVKENILGYIGTNVPCTERRIPLYRMYHPGVTDHFYTTSASERDGAEATPNSWHTEFISGFVPAP